MIINSNAPAIIYTGNGYGHEANAPTWPNTDGGFNNLCQNLVANGFNALMADYRTFGTRQEANAKILKEVGLRWLVDLSDDVQGDRYQFGPECKAAVDQTINEAWGYQLFLQIVQATEAGHVSNAAQALREYITHLPIHRQETPSFAAIEWSSLHRADANALAQQTDFIGAWVSHGNQPDRSHWPTDSLHWRNTLGGAAKATGHKFFFKATFLENEAAVDGRVFLSHIDNYLVQKSIKEWADVFGGLMWTVEGNNHPFEYSGAPPVHTASTIKAIKSINDKLSAS